MTKHNVANLNNVFDRMREKWRNSPEVGYVYTITIDDTAKISAFGLAEVTAKLKLSCSHTGTSPIGLYAGELSLDYETNYGGTSMFLASLGGSMNASNNGWFLNDEFVMNLAEYKKSDEDEFKQTIGKQPESELEGAFNQVVGALMDATNNHETKDYEKNTPKAMWCDWEYRMTEGDMTNFVSMTALGGMGKSNAEQSNDGHTLTGGAIARVPLVGTFKEVLDEVNDGPFPYTIKLYGDKDVVFTLYNYNGSVCMKWHGTVDKIAVSDTIKVQ